MGLRPCNDVTGRCWSGNRTRDTRFMRPMLYPTELSSGGRTGFEPVANGFRRCSASELPSARGTPSPDPRHTPRQRRAHRTGFRTRTAVDRSNDVPHWRLVEDANPCASASACRPCRSIQARRIVAPSRCSLPRASMPGCFGSAMQSRRNVKICLCERQKQNAPGCEPEGVRVASGDRGDRSPRGRSVVVDEVHGRAFVARQAARGRAEAVRPQRSRGGDDDG